MADFTREEVEFIEKERRNYDKWVIKRYVDIRKRITGVNDEANYDGCLYCKKSKRKVYQTFFLEWYESVR